MIWGLIIAAVVNIVLRRLNRLFSINVNNPIGSACTESTIRTLKHLSFTDFAHIFIVELPPFIVLMIFDEVEVVASISVSFVDTNCVQVIRTFIWFFLNVFEDVRSVLSCFENLHLNFVLSLLKAPSMLPQAAAQFFKRFNTSDLLRHCFVQGTHYPRVGIVWQVLGYHFVGCD